VTVTRVLLADLDSRLREDLNDLLHADVSLEVNTRSGRGRSLAEICRSHRPDVVLMVMGSQMHIAELTALMEQERVPVVVLARTSSLGVNAMAAGAVEVLSIDAPAFQIIDSIKVMARLPVVGRRLQASAAPAARALESAERDRARWVAIGASTGGPPALALLLARLPASFPAPVLIAQHMPEDFPPAFAEWLARTTALRVHIAATGMLPENGSIYLAPSEGNLTVAPNGVMRIEPPRPRGPRPSVDRLLATVATQTHAALFGVVLTGMGHDGAEGLLAIRRAGGRTLVQDERSSAVFSMPDHALRLGAAELALPPEVIGDQLCLWAMGAVWLAGQNGSED